MGIQDIINNNEENAPVWDALEETEFLEEEFPVVVNVYSDSSSDTDSASVFGDDYDETPSANVEDASDSVDIIFLVNLERPPSTIQPTEQNEGEKLQSKFMKKIKNISSKSKGNVGKRKARRMENARQLDLLNGDENGNGVDVSDFMPFNCTFRFSQILEDTDLTNEILNPATSSYDENNNEMKTSNKRKNSLNQKGKKITARDAFDNLDASEKTFFTRRNLPMGMINYLDTCVVSFFQDNPTGTYVSEPLSSYERMMLHGIAHYYTLHSFSYNVERCEVRLTKVTNNKNYFDPPCLYLSQYLEQTQNRNNFTKHKRMRRNYSKSC